MSRLSRLVDSVTGLWRGSDETPGAGRSADADAPATPRTGSPDLSELNDAARVRGSRPGNEAGDNLPVHSSSQYRDPETNVLEGGTDAFRVDRAGTARNPNDPRDISPQQGGRDHTFGGRQEGPESTHYDAWEDVESPNDRFGHRSDSQNTRSENTSADADSQARSQENQTRQQQQQEPSSNSSSAQDTRTPEQVRIDEARARQAESDAALSQRQLDDANRGFVSRTASRMGTTAVVTGSGLAVGAGALYGAYHMSDTAQSALDSIYYSVVGREQSRSAGEATASLEEQRVRALQEMANSSPSLSRGDFGQAATILSDKFENEAMETGFQVTGHGVGSLVASTAGLSGIEFSENDVGTLNASFNAALQSPAFDVPAQTPEEISELRGEFIDAFSAGMEGMNEEQIAAAVDIVAAAGTEYDQYKGGFDTTSIFDKTLSALDMPVR